MIKSVENRVWAFDLEWVPDPLAGRLLHAIPDTVTDPAVILQVMWEEGGATEEDPTPFLKTVLCRIVSIAAVERRLRSDGTVTVNLLSLPHDPDDSDEAHEARLVSTFLDALGNHRPQLVGFNSIASDLKILVQRGLILGVRAEGFCRRPNKPWEGVDYFARASDWNVDLMDVLGGRGGSFPSLHEVAVQSGIPGKMEVEGEQVAHLWLAGELSRIVRYNEFDALTTYLVWLRLAHFAGHFTEHQYVEEQGLVRTLLEQRGGEPEHQHLLKYIEEWDRLQETIERYR